jgi:hypothetical protein
MDHCVTIRAYNGQFRETRRAAFFWSLAQGYEVMNVSVITAETAVDFCEIKVAIIDFTEHPSVVELFKF